MAIVSREQFDFEVQHGDKYFQKEENSSYVLALILTL